MRTIKVDLQKGDFDQAIEEAIKVLKFGGTVVFPTDTLYGLGANALDEFGIKRIFNVKGRSFTKPLPILARNMMWVENLAEISLRNRKILERIWNFKETAGGSFGKITVVLPKKSIIPDVLTGGQATVGIRVTEFPFVDQLLKQFGYPITSTSANISGEEGGKDIEGIIRSFANQPVQPNLIIDAGRLPESEPSTVLDLTTEQPKILRVGPSKPEQLMKLLQI